MKSKIQDLAANREDIKNPQDLSHELKISWTTAKQLWDGNIKNTRLGTMIKAADFFGCSVDDLFVRCAEGE